jgi:iron-sulfur cluster repair protein YtfE (RIC family)
MKQHSLTVKKEKGMPLSKLQKRVKDMDTASKTKYMRRGSSPVDKAVQAFVPRSHQTNRCELLRLSLKDSKLEPLSFKHYMPSVIVFSFLRFLNNT